MMYGFWGEGHTSDYPSPIPDCSHRRAHVRGDDRVAAGGLEAGAPRGEHAARHQPHGQSRGPGPRGSGGCWLRSDSIILDEPVQIEALANRPPWLAVIMEDGYHRHYRTDTPAYSVDAAGASVIDRAMLHTLDLGGNYWSLWTEADRLARYHEERPAAFDALRRRIGYRVRPSWIWQRKRYGTAELVVAIANDGVAGVPGVLRVFVETPDGQVRVGGGLDAGHPYAGRLRLASFVLPQGLDGRDVVLKAELETKGVRRPVRWACAQPLRSDGALALRLKRHDDADWRKGV